MKISIDLTLDSAHQLHLEGDSKCNNLHGHRYEIHVEIVDYHEERDIVVNFHEIKKFFDMYDHVFLNDVVPFETTIENMVRHWAGTIKDMFDVSKVTIVGKETENCLAEYTT